MRVLVTGGAGFIGSNFVRRALTGAYPDLGDAEVVVVDLLTYAGTLTNLTPVLDSPRLRVVEGDIRDPARVTATMAGVDAVVHFAAESHVDRSIHGPGAFMRTNVAGTFNLLEAARAHWMALGDADRRAFRFHHVSTDEVYGSLDADAPAFTEQHLYQPNSPYSASKAASDHLVRAWFHTYGLPVLTSNCSNNYGPLHFPEKLIPLMIVNALAGKPLPIYGDGMQVRDWLYVTDHCSAIRTVLAHGRPGETYNIGGGNERTNRQIVHAVCSLLDELRPDPAGPYARLITHVTDRPGHDRRYAIDARKIQSELGWRAEHTFESGIRKTVQWYLDNGPWVARVQSGAYREWVGRQYGTQGTAA